MSEEARNVEQLYRTGKEVWTQKADSWLFENGKAIEYYEFYDTAQVLAAIA